MIARNLCLFICYYHYKLANQYTLIDSDNEQTSIINSFGQWFIEGNMSLCGESIRRAKPTGVID